MRRGTLPRNCVNRVYWHTSPPVCHTRHVILPAILARPAALANQTETVYWTIKRRIIEMDLPPGGQFTESTLANQFGTSKTPVREALVRLHRDGLVQAVPRSGYLVTPITLRSTRELGEFRSILQPKAAEMAALRGLPAESIVRLRELAEGPLSQPFESEDELERYLRAHFEFDSIIINGAGNSRLAAVAVAVLDDMERVMRLVLRLIPWSTTRVAERGAIVDAIERRDPEAAFTAMQTRTANSLTENISVLMNSADISDATISLPAAQAL